MNIVSNRLLYGTPFVELIETTYLDMNDDKKYWVWVRRVNNRRAVVIVATHGDKLVLTKEFRVPIGGYEIGFSAGLIDIGETVERAAKREFKEETGLDLSYIHSVSRAIYNSAGLTNEAIHLVVGEAEGDISQDNNESSEDITTYLMSRVEVARVLQRGDIMFGAKAYMLMDRFVEFGCLYKHGNLY